MQTPTFLDFLKKRRLVVHACVKVGAVMLQCSGWFPSGAMRLLRCCEWLPAHCYVCSGYVLAMALQVVARQLCVVASCLSINAYGIFHLFYHPQKPFKSVCLER